MASVGELDFLVLDAGAIIRGHGLNLFKNTKTIVTVHEVLAEIRDSKARDLLMSLPYEIEERTPSAEAFRAVVEYAKKTGDFAALSKTDLKLIALTYMLEVEIHGSVIAVFFLLDSFVV
jgi:RNA-binding protein NOB1